MLCTVSSLDQLAITIQDRRPWLAQPDVRRMNVDSRVAKLALMITGEQRRAEDVAPVNGGSCSSSGDASKSDLSTKARKSAVLEAARMEGFLNVIADASACYRAGDLGGACRIMFGGRSSAHPDAPPNTVNGVGGGGNRARQGDFRISVPYGFGPSVLKFPKS